MIVIFVFAIKHGKSAIITNASIIIVITTAESLFADVTNMISYIVYRTFCADLTTNVANMIVVGVGAIGKNCLTNIASVVVVKVDALTDATFLLSVFITQSRASG